MTQTAMLLSHGQKFLVIGWSIMEFQWNEVPMAFELWVENLWDFFIDKYRMITAELKNMINNSFESSYSNEKDHNKTNDNKILCIFFTTYQAGHMVVFHSNVRSANWHLQAYTQPPISLFREKNIAHHRIHYCWPQKSQLSLRNGARTRS